MLSLLYTYVKPESVLHLTLYVSLLLLNFTLVTIFQNVNVNVLAATAIWIALSKDATIIMPGEFKYYNNLI